MMMGYGWGMGPIGWVFMVLCWLVVIGLLIWAATSLASGRGIRMAGHSCGNGQGRQTPEEILDLRLARGEIDAEQYRQVREELAEARQARG